MFLSYGLYVCIILETAHHRTNFGIFCNITQNTIPEENNHKIITNYTFFLWEGQVHFEGQGSNFIFGGQKEGVRGCMGSEAQNEGYFCKIPIIKQDTNFISQTVGQTSNPHHCDQHAQKPIGRDFEVILSSSSSSKTTLFTLRNKYDFQIGNAMEKILF